MGNNSNQGTWKSFLDGQTDLPDVSGDFHITVDGIPVCLVDQALLGNRNAECQFSSLNESFEECLKIKSIFPAATVGVFLGKCPHECVRTAA